MSAFKTPGHARGTPAGYSLIELIVAMTILAMLVSVTAYGLGLAPRGTSFRAQSAQVMRTLQLAQSRAIAERRVVSVEFNVRDKLWRLDGGEATAFDPSFAIALRLPDSELTTPDSARISFYPDGSSSGGRLSLQRGDATRAIFVDWISGQISVGEAG